MIFFAVAMVPLAVGALIWWWQSDRGGVGALKALGVLFLLSGSVRWLKKNKPGTFDPVDPPAGPLPPA
jgi:ABC-type sugar transport system permease subunit